MNERIASSHGRNVDDKRRNKIKLIENGFQFIRIRRRLRMNTKRTMNWTKHFRTVFWFIEWITFNIAGTQLNSYHISEFSGSFSMAIYNILTEAYVQVDVQIGIV